MSEASPQKPVSTHKGKRFLFSVLRIVLVLYIMPAWFQRSLIYQPTKAAQIAAKDTILPQALVDVTITSFDKLSLHGWLAFAGVQRSDVPPDTQAVLREGRPLVIIFPGNAGHRENRAYLLDVIGTLGADALIFDYRGYGDNRGSPTEANFIRDAQAIWRYATEELRVPANRIVLYGESLGGGTATRLAADLSAEGVEPGGLILQSTFNSLVDAGRYHFPYLPVSLILIDRFESQKYIVDVKCPILQLHGKLDDIVPPSLGQKLFDAAPQKSVGGISKQLVLLPNSDHNDVYSADIKLVMNALQKFLESVQQRAKKT